MPTTTTDKPKTYEERCARLVEVTDEMQAMLATSETEERNLTEDEAVAFDALGTESKAIRKDKADDEMQISRQLAVNDLNVELDRPRWTPPKDQPNTPEPLDAAGRERGLRDARQGRYALKYFKPVDNSLAARHEANDAAYKTGMLFLMQSGNGAKRDWALQKCRDRGIDIESLSPIMAEGGNAEGGYLVFPEFEATLIDLKEQYGVYQRNAFTIPMGSDTLTIPRRAGGTTVYYPDENAEITKSSMTFDNITLTAKKYAQLTRWSTELNEDSVIAMADMLVGEMAYQFSLAEDTNGFKGDGTSAFASTIGVMFKLINAAGGTEPTASVFTAESGNTTIATLDLGDWESAVGILPVYAEGRARWYMSKTTFFGGPAALMNAAGGNTSAMLASGAPPRFLGYDVEFTQVMPAKSTIVGTDANAIVSIAALLGDLSMTGYMGQRRGVTVRTSDQRFIEFDQLAITATQRIAINNVVGDAVDPTGVAGPMVALQCAAS